MEYTFTVQQYLPIPITKAWEFFSSPGNLALITPPEMEFKILSKHKTPIYEGMHIDYIVKPLAKIPLKWKTEIGKTIELTEFTDRQLKGPYVKWEHHHSFIPFDKGTMMKDEVVYRLPLGFIGDILNKLLVRKKIQYIFTYRKIILIKLFGEDATN